MRIFLEENFIIIFVFLRNFCIFSTISSRFAFMIANFFFAFYLNFFSKHFAIKLLALCT